MVWRLYLRCIDWSDPPCVLSAFTPGFDVPALRARSSTHSECVNARCKQEFCQLSTTLPTCLPLWISFKCSIPSLLQDSSFIFDNVLCVPAALQSAGRGVLTVKSVILCWIKSVSSQVPFSICLSVCLCVFFAVSGDCQGCTITLCANTRLSGDVMRPLVISPEMSTLSDYLLLLTWPHSTAFKSLVFYIFRHYLCIANLPLEAWWCHMWLLQDLWSYSKNLY